MWIKDETRSGVYALLNGHTAKINAVKFLSKAHGGLQTLVTGSSNGQICVWRESQDDSSGFRQEATIEAHEAAINCIAMFNDAGAFASGGADASIRIWTLEEREGTVRIARAQSIELKPKFFPLALSIHPLGAGSSLLIVGGTQSFIQVYVSSNSSQYDFSLQSTLTGHEGWIRSIDVIQESDSDGSDLLMASASQDKYIRLWRFHKGTEVPKLSDPQETLTATTSISKSLSSRANGFDVAGQPYTLTFEALLLGHEDWVYTTAWNTQRGQLKLLSASADGSLAIWEPEATSGVWIPVTRLGEISVQKGSTTATGSAGGFWTCLWVDRGTSVISLGRTGSWRTWHYDSDQDRWIQRLGISGHVRDVKGIAWSKGGSYLISTSSDQTTRLHAALKRGGKRSWHELARPQIHGYDLNCVDSVTNSQFISGADEKLLRIFDQPKKNAALLSRLAGTSDVNHHELPEVASIPVLGLSNMSMETEDMHGSGQTNARQANDTSGNSMGVQGVKTNQDCPPFEDELSRHTLWPEREKLYGHGFEISAVAASHDGSIVSTACKASSVDHAVIRIYETKTWHEVPQRIKIHTLTVTCLRFSDDDKYLLSVGRDRQWAVSKRKETDRDTYELQVSNPKGHARMILGAAWAPSSAGVAFATAGRDKSVKLWTSDKESFMCRQTISFQTPVTAIDFRKETRNGRLLLASGTESGHIRLSIIDASLSVLKQVDLMPTLCPTKTVNQLAWSPFPQASNESNDLDEQERRNLLAVASEDCSVRILSVAIDIYS